MFPFINNLFKPHQSLTALNPRSCSFRALESPPALRFMQKQPLACGSYGCLHEEKTFSDAGNPELARALAGFDQILLQLCKASGNTLCVQGAVTNYVASSTSPAGREIHRCRVTDAKVAPPFPLSMSQER